MWGARLFAAVNSPQQSKFLRDFKTTLDCVIDLSTEALSEVISRETSGLGIDHIVDLGSVEMIQIIFNFLRHECHAMRSSPIWPFLEHGPPQT